MSGIYTRAHTPAWVAAAVLLTCIARPSRKGDVMKAAQQNPTKAESTFPFSVYVLGGGNVGLGMAVALEERKVPVLGLWNRGKERAAMAAKRLRCPVISGPLPADLAAADVVLLTVSERAIATVGADLAGTRFKPGAVLAHASGFLSAAALPPVGPSRGSLHPLLACPTPDAASRDLPSAFYAIEGEHGAVERLARLADFFGTKSKVISAKAKPRYHAAGVLASNCIIALLKLASAEVEAAGLGDLDEPLTRIALGAVEKAARLGISAALTGPALRGDAETVRGHMQAVGPLAREAYRPLTMAALTIAKKRGLAEALAAEVNEAIVSTTGRRHDPQVDCTQPS